MTCQILQGTTKDRAYDVKYRKGPQVDPSATADRWIRRRKFVRRKSAGKITACRISRRILL